MTTIRDLLSKALVLLGIGAYRLADRVRPAGGGDPGTPNRVQGGGGSGPPTLPK